MARISIRGINIGYEEQGRGTSIVFLHGVGSDKTLWVRQLGHFQNQFRAVALDYPGYGESDLVTGALARADIARCMLDAFDALEIAAAHVVGLSMGGVIALEMWRQQPKRLRSLTLADTFAHHPDAEVIVERSRRALGTMTMREFAEMRVPTVLSPTSSAALQRQVIENMSRIDKGTYYWAAEAVWTGDYRADLPKIKVPTLILVGEHDGLTPLQLSEELQIIPDAKLEIIPHAGHISNVDNPDYFNFVVERFLNAAQ